jgi:hypothetical protein
MGIKQRSEKHLPLKQTPSTQDYSLLNGIHPYSLYSNLFKTFEVQQHPFISHNRRPLSMMKPSIAILLVFMVMYYNAWANAHPSHHFQRGDVEAGKSSAN